MSKGAEQIVVNPRRLCGRCRRRVGQRVEVPSDPCRGCGRPVPRDAQCRWMGVTYRVRVNRSAFVVYVRSRTPDGGGGLGHFRRRLGGGRAVLCAHCLRMVVKVAKVLVIPRRKV